VLLKHDAAGNQNNNLHLQHYLDDVPCRRNTLLAQRVVDDVQNLFSFSSSSTGSSMRFPKMRRATVQRVSAVDTDTVGSAALESAMPLPAQTSAGLETDQDIDRDADGGSVRLVIFHGV
jgi:hypothetical protein